MRINDTIYREILTLSSGTQASLYRAHTQTDATGAIRSDVVERYADGFATWARDSGLTFRNWADAWTQYQHLTPVGA